MDSHEIAPLVDHRRLRRAREIRGYTQARLLELAGDPISAPALSQLERGVTRPSPRTLERLAAALDFPVPYFASRVGTAGNDEEPGGYFRSLRSTSGRDRKRALGYVSLLNDLVAVIEDNVRLPSVEVPRFRSCSTTSREDVEQIAAQVRACFDLPRGPVENVVRTLERHGVVVVRLTMDLKKVDAFSVPYTRRPLVVLNSDKFKRVRSRFDAAHELGHLVMHDDVSGWEGEAEQQAHAFAAAFLMPRDDIEGELPASPNWRRLLDMKVQWKVSIGALLKRAKTLGVMPDHTYTNAMKVMSMRGWRTDEPGDDALGPPESPLLLEAAISRLAETGISLESLADGAALPIGEVIKLVVASGDPRPQIDL